MLHKVLIANRGEIAVRVIRACREMGVRSVAVYSEADRRAPHVLEADEAYLIGPPPSAQSYLLGDVIVQTALDCGAEAVHPGYGFLAERASFARSVEDAGLVFIGPTPQTIDAMGDKTEARKRMEAAGVPIVPGLVDAIRDPEELLKAAEGIGYPVLLKAAAGGGGKGMRVVEDPDDLIRSFEAAAREALAAFGDESVYVEKYLDSPRHIEIQILGDGHGKVIHLGERECSIQRRHQKLVEEAPSPICTPALREAMGSAAVRAGEAVDYRGAGTVEFLFKDGEFYFLEMNTRLQVEHPVTELVHGIDLVHWQLRIAAGQPLTIAQEDLRVDGHAIECRITSEDPFNGFLPSTGAVGHLDIPAGPGVRWDGGIASGFEVGLHYDPLLGKLIVHAPDREAAIQRMSRALRELAISGLETSVPFHRRVMEEPDFRRGDLSIRYLEEHPDLLEVALPAEDLRVVVVAAALLEEQARRNASVIRVQDREADAMSPWQQAVHPARRGT